MLYPMPIKRRAASLILVLATALPCWALTVDFDIQPRILHRGEPATARFTVQGVSNPPRPDLPTVKGLQIVGTGQETHVSIVNMRAERSMSYTYQVLPTQTGKITVGPFSYTAGGSTVTVPAVTIEVLDSAAANGRQTSANPSDMLRARLDVESTNVYLQQVFDVTLSIYSRGLNLGRDTQLLNMPEAGLNVLPFQEVGGGREVLNDQVYSVRRFRGRIQAITAGSFTLAPTARVTVLVQERRTRRGGLLDDFFDDAFFGGLQARPVDVPIEPVTLNVLPLPAEGRPAGFSGAIGQFTFNAKTQPETVRAGEPVTLTMEINGRGNIETVTAPAWALDEKRFKIYEPRLLNRDVNGDRVQGRMVFEQVVIPREPGDNPLPAVAFSYFDPIQRRYETVKTGPFPLTIMPASSTAVLVAAPDANGSDTPEPLLGTDIVYLKAPPNRLHPARRPWYLLPIVGGVQIVPPLALGLLFGIARRNARRAGDVARLRRQRAPRSARAALRRAQHALRQHDTARFHEATASALADYFGNRLNLAPGEVSGDGVGAALERAGLDPALRAEVANWFEQCERARFGGTTSTKGPLPPTEYRRLAEQLDELHRLLKTCEEARL